MGSIFSYFYILLHKKQWIYEISIDGIGNERCVECDYC